MTSLFDQARQWIADDVDAADQVELGALLTDAMAETPNEGQHLAELRDRFVGTLQFGTAGLRGAMAAGPNRMNRAVVIKAAAGLGNYLLGATPAGAPPKVVIGFDARHHSVDFAEDSAAVLTALGCEVSLLPAPLPTPLLAFLVRHLAADAGVMVTASHNPAADNGYKVYLGGRIVTDAGQGAQIVPPYDGLIAAEIAKIGAANQVERATGGWTVLGSQAVDDYVAAVLTLNDSAPRALRIVTTSMHGVGATTLERVLALAGFADVTPVAEQRNPNPDFPTVAFPNPEEKGAIDLAIAKAREVGADLVLANDPDADRCAAAVPNPRAEGPSTSPGEPAWRMLHGDEVGALLGWAVSRRLEGTPRDGAESAPASHAASSPPALANSIVSSRLLSRIAADHRLDYAATLTGFKWISRTPGLVFGYEEALGYCVDPAHVRDKDGISASLLLAQLANSLRAEGRTLIDLLDDLARRYGLYLTDQLSARFSDLSQIPATMARLRQAPPATLGDATVTSVVDLSAGSADLPPTDGVMLLCADDSRVIVRPSGTEPKVKCYLEVIRPVSSGADFAGLTAVRAEASTALEAIKADMTAALGL
ncbi:MAG: phospho-sugar mutase [Promicromonosporaceae bacterium]|nr:phospho-sugar mutase [Promicromonosporaceae bacterium]